MNVAQTLKSELASARKSQLELAQLVRLMRSAQRDVGRTGRIVYMVDVLRLEAQVDARLDELLGPVPPCS